MEPALPRGFVGDPVHGIFHRIDCPLAAGIDPRVREFFVTPFEAVNARMSPCEYCRPMSGWK